MGADDTLTYSHRPKPFANELVLRLDSRELVAERGRARQVFALSRIERIDLAYAPRNIARLAFRCLVRDRDGRTLAFDNISWKSLIETDRQDREYHDFVAALVTRAEAAGGGVTLHAGISPFKYRGMLGLGIALATLLLVTLVRALMQSGHAFAGFAAITLVYLGWWLSAFLARNRPRPFTAGAIPEGVVPAVTTPRP